MSTAEKIKGAAQKIGGDIKQGVGRALDDEEMVREGQRDKEDGEVRESAADLDNKVKGTLEHAKGRVKSTVGAATGDRSLEAGGKLDELKGKIQKKISE